MKMTTISELKQHLSARLKNVKAGETFLVTDRRVPVALLSPLPSETNDAELAGLVAAGVLAPPRKALNPDRFLALPRGTWKTGLSSAIAEEREDR